MTAPLERMYPNRCYDCLVPISIDEVICEHCKVLYERAKQR